MEDQLNLESLYVEAQSALKRKEYDRAAELLTRIIAVDENYKDASRLLAQAVRLKRRRWYSHPALWSVIVAAVVIGLSTWLLPKLATQTQPAQGVSAPVALPTSSPAATIIPTQTNTPTATPSPMPTAIPLPWKRISMGQEFQRDAVTAFATDKNDPDVIYAGMKNSGVYKTIDGGASWYPSHNGLASAQVESLLIDSQNPQILYAGTMGGIFKTEDGGENWLRIGDGTYLLVDMQDSSHLYARDENSVYETKDQGNTWVSVYALKKECPDEIASWAVHPANGNMLFIGGGEKCAGVYQSTDNGNAWALIGLEDKPNLNPLVIALDERENYSIYVYFDAPIAESGIYVSHDDGASWSLTGISNGCYLLVSDLDNPATIYCAGSMLRIMRKKGDPWQGIPNTQSKTYSAIHIDRINGANRIIAAGMDKSKQSIPYVGIFIYEDSDKTWITKDNGIGSARAELKIDPNAGMYLATYYVENKEGMGCSLYRASDNKTNWKLITKRNWFPPSWCGPAFDAGNVLYVAETGALNKSWDDGETWLWEFQGGGQGLPYALPSYYRNDHYTYEGSQSISANPYANGLIYDVGNVIYYSTDAGLSWQLSAGSEGSRDARLFYTDQSKMIFDIGRYQQKYSTDNGKTWQACGADVTTSRSDTRLALDLQGERLYLATPGQGILISADKCQSWTPSNNGLTNLFVNTLALDPNDSNTVYAGTDGGAYISYDAGVTWGQVNDGLLGATVVYSIAVDKESNVYAATPYGVFKLESK